MMKRILLTWLFICAVGSLQADDQSLCFSDLKLVQKTLDTLPSDEQDKYKLLTFNVSIGPEDVRVYEGVGVLRFLETVAGQFSELFKIQHPRYGCRVIDQTDGEPSHIAISLEKGEMTSNPPDFSEVHLYKTGSRFYIWMPNQQRNADYGFVASQDDKNLEAWQRLSEMVTANQLSVTAPMSITTTDLLTKVWGLKPVESSLWEVSRSFFSSELSKPPRWKGVSYDNEVPPFPVSYLGKEIGSVGVCFDKNDDKTVVRYRYWFSFDDDKKACKDFAQRVVADFQAQGLSLRKLNTAKSNLQHAWGVVHGDLFIEMWMSHGVSSQVCIEIYPAGSENHLWWKQHNPGL